MTGAAAPTGAGGHTMVTSTEAGTDTLQATREQDIPSNRVKVCVNPDPSRCPRVHGKRIVGSGRGRRDQGHARLGRDQGQWR